MERWRLLTRRHRLAAIWLLLAALALRLLVPIGFMPVASAGGLSLAPCPEWNASAHAAPHERHDRDSHGDAHRHGDSPCAFAGLGLPTLSGGDVPHLAAPRAAGAVAPIPLARMLRLRAPARERPPSQAPPITR